VDNPNKKMNDIAMRQQMMNDIHDAAEGARIVVLIEDNQGLTKMRNAVSTTHAIGIMTLAIKCCEEEVMYGK
jgi:hypothetical protein